MQFFKVIINLLKNVIILNIFFLKISNILSFFNKNKFKKNLKSKNKICLIEAQFHSAVMFILYFFVAAFLGKNYKIIFFNYSRVDYLFKNKLFKFFYFRYFNLLNKIIEVELINLYETSKTIDEKISEKIFKSLKTKQDIFNIKYKNLKIGRFIYQSYCRELLEKTGDPKDIRLKKFISEAVSLADRLKEFLNNNNVKKLFISHVIFIRYGILSLLAKNKGIQVNILYPRNRKGYLRQIKKLEVNKEIIQKEKFWNFKKEFKKVKNKALALELSKKDLNQRIYKNKKSLKLIAENSPYKKNKILNFNKSDLKKDKIIILPACFFDAVGFFRYCLFPDNYTWIKYLLKEAKKTNFDWYIKTHPDGIKKNNQVVKELKTDYPFLKILKPDTSNLTFKVNNFKSMFTYQGAAVHEFEFMLIPSVVVSDNVSSNYKFSKPIKKVSEFKNLIKRANKLKAPNNLKELYEFNYMFNFDASNDIKNCYFLSNQTSQKLLNLNSKRNFYSEFKKVNIFLNEINYKKLKKLKDLVK